MSTHLGPLRIQSIVNRERDRRLWWASMRTKTSYIKKKSDCIHYEIASAVFINMMQDTRVNSRTDLKMKGSKWKTKINTRRSI